MKIQRTDAISGIGILYRWMVRRLAGTDASQIVELAVALPLLLVIVIGITDFGMAFSLKQLLHNAAREGARFAANQTMSDVTEGSNPPPTSVAAIRDVVDSYLISAHVNDCGLGSITQTAQSGLSWTFTANTNCGGNALTLVIDRGNPLQTAGASPVTVEATHITLSYPYQWTFGRVMSVILPSPTYAAGTTLITVEAEMANLN